MSHWRGYFSSCTHRYLASRLYDLVTSCPSSISHVSFMNYLFCIPTSTGLYLVEDTSRMTDSCCMLCPSFRSALRILGTGHPQLHSGSILDYLNLCGRHQLLFLHNAPALRQKGLFIIRGPRRLASRCVWGPNNSQ